MNFIIFLVDVTSRNLDIQVKVLLKVIKEFDGTIQDAEYAVDVVDLMLQCVELSCRLGGNAVIFLVLVSKLTFSHNCIAILFSLV